MAWKPPQAMPAALGRIFESLALHLETPLGYEERFPAAGAWAPFGPDGDAGAASVVKDRLLLWPYPLSRAVQVHELAAMPQTAGDGTARLGLYRAHHGTLAPHGNPIVSASIATTSVALTAADAPVSLKPDLYWVAFVDQSTSVGTWRGVRGFGVRAPFWSVDPPSPTTFSPSAAYKSSVSGALPTLDGSASLLLLNNATVPLVWANCTPLRDTGA